jgi:hypothetical protein
MRLRPTGAPVGLLAPVRLPGPGRLTLPGSRPAQATVRHGAYPPLTDPPSFERPTVPAPVGERGDEAALVLQVIDESASERGIDPHGYRHVAGRRTLALLRDELRHPGDRLAVVHFGLQPRPWLGPTDPHTRRGNQALRRALRPAGGEGGTDIRIALALAARLVPRSWDGAVVVVLLSDGQDSSTAQQLREAVGRFPVGSVHVISVAAELPTTWASVPLGSTTVVPSMARPDEVEWVTARALYQALGLDWNGPLLPPTEPTSKEAS